MKQAIIVNGVPASGKSTVGALLTRALLDAGLMAVPLGLDVVKEALFIEVGIGDREYNRMLGRASYRSIFDTIAGFPSELVPVIDAWHGFQPQSVLQGQYLFLFAQYVFAFRSVVGIGVISLRGR